MVKEIFKELNKYQFHDQSVLNITFNFSSNTFEICTGICFQEDYEVINFVFANISNLDMKFIVPAEIKDFMFESVSYEEIDSKTIRIFFRIVASDKNSGFAFSFDFSELSSKLFHSIKW